MVKIKYLCLLLAVVSHGQNFYDDECVINSPEFSLRVSNTGLIGSIFGNPALEFPPGSGHSILYKGALLVGTISETGDTLVSSGMGNNQTSRSEFHSPGNGHIQIDSTVNALSHTDYVVEYGDNFNVVGHQPLGLHVKQRTLKWGNAPVILQVYQVWLDTTLNNVFIGICMDFDISVGGLEDHAGSTVFTHDSTSYPVSYIQNAIQPGTYAGIAFVDEPAASSRIWSREADPVNDYDLYQLMTADSISPNADLNSDYRILQSRGPFELTVEDTLEVVVALAIAPTSQALTGMLISGKNRWNNVSSNGSLPPSYKTSTQSDTTVEAVEIYPNPFNMNTAVHINLPHSTEIELTLYNLLGETVYKWDKTEYKAGTHTILWDGTRATGKRVASGIYLLSISAGNKNYKKKVLLLK